MAVFDLNKVKAEAAGDPFEFTWGDGKAKQTFTIASDGDVRWVVALQGKDLRSALVRLLGQADFERLDAVDKPFTSDHLLALVEAFTAHAGVDTGKSKPSAKRSTSTARR